MDTRQEGLGAMVVEKWLEENHSARLHLEQYDSEKLHSLMLSRIRKLSREINEEHTREPMPIRTESLDQIFQSLLDAGLLAPVNPKVAGEEERAAAKEAADRAAINADVACESFYLQHSSRECEEAAKTNPYFRQWLNSAKYESLRQPDTAPASENLFIVRAIRTDNYRPVWVSNDSNFSTTYSQEYAVPLGRTRSERAAEALRKSGHAAVTVLPV